MANFSDGVRYESKHHSADCKLGLMINIGEELVKTGISRVANGL